MNWLDRLSKVKGDADAIKAAISETSAYISDEVAKAMPASVFEQWKADTAYEAKVVIVYKDITYRVVQAHTSQAGWLPDATPALYSSFTLVDDGGEEQVEVWKQPTGAHDAYNIGDKVMYNSKVYESLINGNTYSPDAYPAGWKLVN